jgi:ubiquinone/menaquinone biosynthesis C-methylase UbiE
VKGFIDFNTLAHTWDNDPRKIERARLFAEEILRYLHGKNSTKALEFGCGTGLVSFFLQPCFEHITLVDLSEGMIEVVKKKIRKDNITNMHPLQTDLFDAVLPDEHYSLVYTLMTLHHIVDLRAVVSKFYSLLQPGGVLCIADLEQEDGSYHGEGFEGNHGFVVDDLKHRLLNTGFENLTDRRFYVYKKRNVSGVVRGYPLFFLMGTRPQ